MLNFNFNFQFQISIFNFQFQFSFSILDYKFLFRFLLYDLSMRPRITWNWTLATINHKPDSYCLPLVRPTNDESDRWCLRSVRSTYCGSHQWCVVLMFSPIFLPPVLHDIEFVYAYCYLLASIKNSGFHKRRPSLYCNMTNEDLTFTRDFNMPARVRVHVNVTSYICSIVYAGPNSLT